MDVGKKKGNKESAYSASDIASSYYECLRQFSPILHIV